MLNHRQYASECLRKMYHFLFVVLASGQLCLGQYRAPPQVETRPNLLDSFIPASMQIIAHITELMKYDLKPPSAGSTTTTTMRPTRPHKPGIYQPDMPPGPEAYFSKGFSYEEYVDRLRYPSGYDYWERYRLEGRSLDVPQVLGKDLRELLRRANTVEEVEEGVEEFSDVYDDGDFRYFREKKKPPTRAYVTLLSLYDLLNKESKKLGLNKYNGYSPNILKELVDISTGTSAEQLRQVLKKISQRKDTKNPQVLKKIDALIKDLEDDNSYLNEALRYIPPLPFAL